MRYREVGLLAEGGMAVVARAESDDGATVVVKRVRPPFCFDPSFLRLFADEGAVHAALVHENIVRLLDAGEDEAGPFLVFEHVDGTDLANVMQDPKPLAVEGVLAIALPLFRALAAAHTTCSESGACLQVVHRDVSPGNVLIGDDGSVKLADFGIASFSLKSEHTVAGEMKGKFAYMAPEQSRGEKVGPRADLFAAGILLWEALAGQRLFDGPTDADVVAAVRHQPTPRLDTLRSDLPPALVELVAALLHKDADQRPASAQEVVSIVEDMVLTLGLDDGLARHAARLARAAPRRAISPSDSIDGRRRTQRLVGADAAAMGGVVVRRSRTPRWVIGVGAVLGVVVVVAGLMRLPPPVESVVKLPDTPLLVRPIAAPPPPGPVVAPAIALPVPSPVPSPAGKSPAASRTPRTGERPAIFAKGEGGAPPSPSPPPSYGTLSIASEPWATVTVDGALVDRETPLLAFPLPAGPHTVVLENPVYQLKRTLTLDVPANGAVKRFVDLNRP